MIKANFSGRSGNILLINVGLSILSKKFDLKVYEYKNVSEFKSLNLNLYDGKRIIENLENLYDIYHSHVQTGPYGHLMDIMKRTEDIQSGIFFDGNFQVGDFVKTYREEILSHFDLNYDNSYSKDLFIHIRLDDVAHLNPGLDYYIKAIEQSSYERIFLSTDSINHEIIQNLRKKYNITIYEDTPVETINFAKNFGNIILSKGTFSWWIGVLSKSNKIIYPVGDRAWYGDIFVYDDWIPLSI